MTIIIAFKDGVIAKYTTEDFANSKVEPQKEDYILINPKDFSKKTIVRNKILVSHRVITSNDIIIYLNKTKTK